MNKKEEMGEGHHAGLLGWSFSLIGLISAIIPYLGLVLPIVGTILSVRQSKLNRTEWSRVGKILGIVGIIISIVVTVVYTYLIINAAQLLLQQNLGGA